MNTFEYGLQNIRLPIVSVKIEDNILCFILDTGSTCSLIDRNVVEYFKDIAKPIGEYFINGIDGTKHKVDVVHLPFIINEKEYQQDFCVKPLHDAFKDIENECGLQVHGLLGTDFLMENKCFIDFKEMILNIGG